MLHAIHTTFKRRVSMQATHMRRGYLCPIVASASVAATYLAALAPEPTNRLMPTLLAFFPLSCACIGCSFSHLSSSLYASTAASKSQSACCMYSVATSYLSVGGILVSPSVLIYCQISTTRAVNANLLGNLARHHPSSYLALFDLLFLALERPWT